MKKILFFLLISAGFYACKKDTTTTPVKNEDTIISVVYADTLTSQVKVGYATNIADTFPVASADASAPVLDSVHTQVYKVAKGRYLVVKPKVLSGTPVGYYVQIAGANSYFKVDYTQASNLRRSAIQKGMRAAGGISDSTIVFKLPDTIQEDTFYVKYAAYDAQNKVSNTVAEQVLVLPDVNNAAADSLYANWRFVGVKHTLNGQAYDDWSIDTLRPSSYAYYRCVDNKLVAGSDQSSLHIPATLARMVEILTFTRTTCTDNYTDYDLSIDIANSSCSNYLYTVTKEYKYLVNVVSGLSYNPATRQLIIVDEDLSTGLTYRTYQVTELTSTIMVLSYPVDEKENPSTDPSRMRFVKFEKQ